MNDLDAIDLTALTDEQLAALRERMDEENYRRYMLAEAGGQIAEIIRNYLGAGGKKEDLATQLEDALTTET